MKKPVWAMFVIAAAILCLGTGTFGRSFDPADKRRIFPDGVGGNDPEHPI